ncbi:MAG: RluA family pseudouridine synthase [Thermodesulfobacteriota bacterium]
MNDQVLNFYIPSWPVLFSDNHLLALYKPAGLLVQGDRTGDATLIAMGREWVKRQYHKPGNVFLGMVHRLDRPVAGVVLFCRTSKAAGRVSEQFRSGQTRKKYMAVLEGKLKDQSGRLVNHLERRGNSGRVVTRATSTSDEARLSFRLLDTAGDSSLVEIDLETGRHHQIRLQFAHIGHPVLGDLRYGASGPLPEKQIALFAASLTVTHPTLGRELTFSAPLPRKWPWPKIPSGGEAPPWNWREIESEVSPQLSSTQ